MVLFRCKQNATLSQKHFHYFIVMLQRLYSNVFKQKSLLAERFEKIYRLNHRNTFFSNADHLRPNISNSVYTFKWKTWLWPLTWSSLFRFVLFWKVSLIIRWWWNAIFGFYLNFVQNHCICFFKFMKEQSLHDMVCIERRMVYIFILFIPSK